MLILILPIKQYHFSVIIFITLEAEVRMYLDTVTELLEELWTLVWFQDVPMVD